MPGLCRDSTSDKNHKLVIKKTRKFIIVKNLGGNCCHRLINITRILFMSGLSWLYFWQIS